MGTTAVRGACRSPHGATAEGRARGRCEGVRMMLGGASGVHGCMTCSRDACRGGAREIRGTLGEKLCSGPRRTTYAVGGMLLATICRRRQLDAGDELVPRARLPAPFLLPVGLLCARNTQPMLLPFRGNPQNVQACVRGGSFGRGYAAPVPGPPSPPQACAGLMVAQAHHNQQRSKV